MMVAWVWQRAGLKPHRIERYMASDNPDFELKGGRYYRRQWQDRIELIQGLDGGLFVDAKILLHVGGLHVQPNSRRTV
jgi:hypothetical protein